jgi:hypothetical protein
MKKRGQTSHGTSTNENPKEIIDIKEAEDPTSKRRCVIVD